MKKSRFMSLVVVFASLNVVCDSLMGLPWPPPGIWFSWVFLMEPITGIVLGPYVGFLSSLIGVMIGHFIYFRGPYEFLFTLGVPLGAMISGFLFRRKWKMVLIYYTVLFLAYFVTPIAWQLPIWGMWDTYVAYGCLLIVALLMIKGGTWKLESRGLLHAMAVCTFIGLEADVLFRIFIFIPCQTYRLFYGLNLEALHFIWAAGAAETPIKVAISTLVIAIVGPPIIKVIRERGLFQQLS